jgi:XTP/dITP diphosphohydrolase
MGGIMTVWIATGNIHKKAELINILSPGNKKTPWDVKIPSEAGLDFDPEETGKSFLENALLKAGALHRLLEDSRPAQYKSGDPVIADDSGICVDALGGRPGIFSARYCGMHGPVAGSQQGKLTDAERNTLLLAELGDNPKRSARFVCALVLYYSPDRFFTAQETLEGELVKNAESARGKGGFGYDPILYIPELGRTVAELSGGEKNIYSHRAKAGKAISRILWGMD